MRQLARKDTPTCAGESVGHGSRDLLPRISPNPARLFLFRTPRERSWSQAAILDPPFQSPRVPARHRTMIDSRARVLAPPVIGRVQTTLAHPSHRSKEVHCTRYGAEDAAGSSRQRAGGDACRSGGERCGGRVPPRLSERVIVHAGPLRLKFCPVTCPPDATSLLGPILRLDAEVVVLRRRGVTPLARGNAGLKRLLRRLLTEHRPSDGNRAQTMKSFR